MEAEQEVGDRMGIQFNVEQDLHQYLMQVVAGVYVHLTM